MTDLDRALAEWRRQLAVDQRALLESLAREIRGWRAQANSGATSHVAALEAAIALLEAAL